MPLRSENNHALCARPDALRQGYLRALHAKSFFLLAQLPFLLRKKQKNSFIYVCALCARPAALRQG